jgi:hypothetical protein
MNFHNLIFLKCHKRVSGRVKKMWAIMGNILRQNGENISTRNTDKRSWRPSKPIKKYAIERAVYNREIGSTEFHDTLFID